MAWFNDYDRAYSRGWNRGSGRQQWGYGGGWSDRGAYGEGSLGRAGGGRWQEGSGFGGGWGPYDAGRSGWSAWSGERRPFRGGYGGFAGDPYGYDYEQRVPPQQSPAYGRQADQQVRQWARRYGYDEGYEITPRRNRNSWQGNESPGRGGFGAGERHRDRGFFDRGWDRRW